MTRINLGHASKYYKTKQTISFYSAVLFQYQVLPVLFRPSSPIFVQILIALRELTALDQLYFIPNQPRPLLHFATDSSLKAKIAHNRKFLMLIPDLKRIQLRN